ncbi:MAG: hypothetical protein KatS3mg124_1047 [Porticoccaceae bacterium]|nr:MAG: hypothetical protein KatS3mg124_1047 [Porticoccaceae bacterium]
MSRIAARVTAGLAALLPVVATLYLLYWIGASLERALRPVVEWLVGPDRYLPGLGLAASLPILFLMGLAVDTYGLRYLVRLGDRLLERIPLVKSIHGALSDLVRMFAPGRSTQRGAVVAAEVAPGVRLLGLVTARETGARLFPARDGRPAKVGVYLPMSYQIGGFTVYLDPERLEPLDLSVEEALRIALTGGAPGGGREERPRQGKA